MNFFCKKMIFCSFQIEGVWFRLTSTILTHEFHSRSSTISRSDAHYLHLPLIRNPVEIFRVLFNLLLFNVNQQSSNTTSTKNWAGSSISAQHFITNCLSSAIILLHAVVNQAKDLHVHCFKPWFLCIQVFWHIYASITWILRQIPPN